MVPFPCPRPLCDLLFLPGQNLHPWALQGPMRPLVPAPAAPLSTAAWWVCGQLWGLAVSLVFGLAPAVLTTAYLLALFLLEASWSLPRLAPVAFLAGSGHPAQVPPPCTACREGHAAVALEEGGLTPAPPGSECKPVRSPSAPSRCPPDGQDSQQAAKGRGGCQERGEECWPRSPAWKSQGKELHLQDGRGRGVGVPVGGPAGGRMSGSVGTVDARQGKRVPQAVGSDLSSWIREKPSGNWPSGVMDLGRSKRNVRLRACEEALGP